MEHAEGRSFQLKEKEQGYIAEGSSEDEMRYLRSLCGYDGTAGLTCLGSPASTSPAPACDPHASVWLYIARKITHRFGTSYKALFGTTDLEVSICAR